MKKLLLALLLASGVPGGLALADDSEVGPLLESLDGAPSALVRSEDGQTREVKQGEELVYGDQIQTGTAAVRVAYEDGTQVLLPASSTASLKKGELDLDDGEARTLVEPAAQPAAPQAGTSPHKFIIRTRSAVLGVRGTDFVVSSQGDQTSVHTVDGVVDIAHDEADLRAGHGQSVSPGQYSEANAAHPPTAPARYDVSKYLSDFHQRHPRLASMHEEARRDAASGRLKQRFQQLRARPRAAALRRQLKQRQAQQPRHPFRQQIEQRREGRQEARQKRQERRKAKRENRQKKGQREAQ